MNKVGFGLTIFFRKYIKDSFDKTRSIAIQILFLVLLFALLEWYIENFIDTYWVHGILEKLQSKNLVLFTLLAILSAYSFAQIHSKNFLFRVHELCLLIFYINYRFVNKHWDFDHIAFFITWFDLIPIIVVLPKLISAIIFINGAMVASTRPGIIDPDIPLSESNSTDQLKRRKFADELVEVLSKTRPSERALVIGLNGTWGSGKTSLQFMIQRSLIDKSLSNQFYIIHFNPWHCPEGKSLDQSFLAIIRKSIQSEQFLVSKSIDRYASILLNSTENILFKSNMLEGLKHSPSFQDELVRLKSRIGDLRKTLLVIIDDLDRLSGDELLQVFRLVRIVGDFPNTIYIILYDKEYVRSVVKQSLNEYNAKSFIEKIIQVEYTLPENNIDNLRQVFTNHLTKSLNLAMPESTDFWTSDAINDVVRFKEFSYFIANIRDIKRLANNFLLRYKMIYSEVNFSQFLLLEFLRYRHPEFLTIIFDDKQVFLGQIARGNLEFVAPDLPTGNRFWKEVASDTNARAILRALTEYKDKVNSIFESTFFSNYFTLTLVDSHIYESDFDRIFENQESDTLELFRGWIVNNIDLLLYRFRNYNKISTIDGFIVFINYLIEIDEGLILNSDEAKQREDSIFNMFVNKYQQLENTKIVDRKELYEAVRVHLKISKRSHFFESAFKIAVGTNVRGDSSGNPLTQGWKEANGASTDKEVAIFQVQTESSIGKYIVFNADFNRFRFDYDFAVPSVCSVVNFVLMLTERPSAFYIKMQVSSSKGSSIVYFKILRGHEMTYREVDNEYVLILTPISKAEFWSFQIDINEKFRETFERDGLKLESVTGICVRGAIGFYSFDIF